MVKFQFFTYFLLAYAAAGDTNISREYLPPQQDEASKAGQAQHDLTIEMQAQPENILKPTVAEDESPSKSNNVLEEAIIEQSKPKQSSVSTETEVSTTTYFPCQTSLPIGYPCIVPNGLPNPYITNLYGGPNNFPGAGFGPGPNFQPGFNGPNFGGNFFPGQLGPNFIPGQPGFNFLPGQQGPNNFPGQQGPVVFPLQPGQVLGQQGPVALPLQPGQVLGQQGPNFIPGQGPFGIPDPNFGNQGFLPGQGFPGGQAFPPGQGFPGSQGFPPGPGFPGGQGFQPGFGFPFSSDNRGQQELASLNRAPSPTNPRVLSDTEYDSNGGYVYEKPKLTFFY